jgi:uncharacterized membrane protein
MLSFTLTRVDNNPTESLVVKISLGGEATYGVDYTAVVKTGTTSTPLTLENPLVTDVYAVTFPSGSLSVELICTPLVGLVQPIETVVVNLINTPGRFTVNSAKASALGQLYFV